MTGGQWTISGRAILFGLLLVAGIAHAEVGFKSLSVTDTSQTFQISKPSNAVTICNYSTVIVYYRIFNWGETTAAATTSHIQLPAGTATAPICISWVKEPTQPAPFGAVSIIGASAGPSTVHVLYE